MKLMLIRQWVDICGTLLFFTTARPRPDIAAVDPASRRCRLSMATRQQKTRQPLSAAKPLYIAGLNLLVGVGLTIAPAMAQEAADSAVHDTATSWNLTAPTVVSKGQTHVSREGEFTRDFILESKATAVDQTGAVVPAGTFKLVLSAFSPAYDQRGQKKGSWYVGGKWFLTDSSLAPSDGSPSARHRAGEMSGQIKAELTFNPFVTQKNWTAKVWLPMTRIAPAAQAASSQPARGEGALTLDDKREGKFSLNLKLWPTMQH